MNDIETLQGLYEEVQSVAILDRQLITESSLSRIFQFIKENRSFAMISAYKLGLPLVENKERHNNLRNDIRNLNLGYIETYGGYSYGKDQFSHEKSFFIPNIDRKTAIALGKKYDQQAVIYKDDNEFASIFTKDGSKIDDLGKETKFKEGEVETKFAKEKGLTFDPYVVYNIAYSALVKNNSRSLGKDKERKTILKPEAVGKKEPIEKFAFHLENFKLEYVVETIYPTWTEAMGRKNQLKYLKII